MATSEQVKKSRNRNRQTRQQYLDYQKAWRESKKGANYMNEYMKAYWKTPNGKEICARSRKRYYEKKKKEGSTL